MKSTVPRQMKSKPRSTNPFRYLYEWITYRPPIPSKEEFGRMMRSITRPPISFTTSSKLHKPEPKGVIKKLPNAFKSMDAKRPTKLQKFIGDNEPVSPNGEGFIWRDQLIEALNEQRKKRIQYEPTDYAALRAKGYTSK